MEARELASDPLEDLSQVSAGMLGLVLVCTGKLALPD
jgi:hypothetical protein